VARLALNRSGKDDFKFFFGGKFFNQGFQNIRYRFITELLGAQLA